MCNTKRLSIITVKTEGAEQIFSLCDVKAKRPLSLSGWVKRISDLGYAIEPSWIVEFK